MGNEARDLLRRLAANDERSIRSIFAETFEPGARKCLSGPRLSRGTRELVRLVALLALDAPTASLRWSVELACAAGLDETTVVGALVGAAPITGSAQVVASARSLALALDLEPPVEITARALTGRAVLRSVPARSPRIARRPPTSCRQRGPGS